MSLRVEDLKDAAALLHGLAEHRFVLEGRAPTWLYLLPERGDGPLLRLPFGRAVDDTLAHALAVRTGAVAAVMAGEYWVGPTPVPVETAKRLPLADLPEPSRQPGRQEAVITTAVMPGHKVVRHVSMIERGIFGPALHRSRVEDAEQRGDGLAAWLASIL